MLEIKNLKIAILYLINLQIPIELIVISSSGYQFKHYKPSMPHILFLILEDFIPNCSLYFATVLLETSIFFSFKRFAIA